ncbi:Bax inhibitor-1/YccA family membrane protein [Ornithinimicrobium pratense]|uniref:Bax inhibitor-1/YccA family protein n=1 Tax=Ornithinimicrobium pratense TaxID=2593973 RepID=A0A5J6V461_9MICO|nr:Bax inhibitor-1/YccA family protein [Ornithinimicrobium pratense]QFG67763.1 Bax inhibitor-1/YccA family protein [Ornithinimicrobium pratense]
MAVNPVFNRIDSEAAQGRYAGFGQQQPGAYPPPQGAPHIPAQGGYPGPSESLTDEQLRQMYTQAPAGPAQTGRLTLDDVVVKSLMLFGIVVAVAAGTWYVVGGQPGIATPIWLLGMFGSLALSFVIARAKQVKVPLVLTHAVLQGLFLGAVSATFEMRWPGVVSTAVVATMATFAGMFIGWKFGVIKVTSKSRRIFSMAAMGYLVFLLVNLGASFLGFGEGWGVFGMQFGWAIALLGVGLASYSLAVDFDSVDKAVRMGAPEKYSWLLGHGLVASLVWLYIEFLRLFAILQSD